MIFQFLINGLVNGSMIALVALGFSLVYNTTRVFHIAYAGVYVWAGYLLYLFSTTLNWPVWAAFLAAMAGSAMINLLCEILLYAPLKRQGRSHDAVMISSVGVLIILISAVELLWGNAAFFLDHNWAQLGLGTEHLLPPGRLFTLLMVSGIIGLFFIFLKFTRLGIRFRAIRDNEALMHIYGVSSSRVKILIFIISGLLLAVASGLTALDVGIHPSLGIPVFINAFVALVIGGVGRFDGPVIGGVILGLLQSMTEYFFHSKWVILVTFILLIAFLIVKPGGIIPERKRAF